MEARLRWAGMEDELENLQHQLRLRGCLNRHKVNNIRGQRASTRARTAQDAVDVNVKKAANAYRRHRLAYLALVGKGDWEKTMQELRDSDCRGLGDRLIEQMAQMSQKRIADLLAGRKGADNSGDTHYSLPWIWWTSTEDFTLKVTDELMVEWCKSRARAQRWVEEVRLLDEEIRRLLAFTQTMAAVWDARRTVGRTLDLTPRVARWASDDGWADGVRAYAFKQGHIRRHQHATWRAWLAPLRVQALTFLDAHTEDGVCVTPVDSVMDRVAGMSLTAEGVA
ncbi:hypothetical protein PENSPDRAFT_593856 [Peniophora sp. CONT]|nr:hypothetical protein PENSPDRAFT_593856 [Peniophora sp. CONT]